MDIGQSLITELEDAIRSGSKEKRIDSLRRITDLFVADADRLNNQQIDVFDDVLGHLINRIEGKALAELSRRLGPINNAPADVVRRLARDDNILVAEPILTQSARLRDEDLIEIAGTKTQAHLLAISARSQIGTAVTDALLQRGDGNVFHRLAENSGAKFSENGFTTLVKRSEGDGKLAEKVGLRLDIPLRLFRELLLRATEAVRSRLLALAGPESREQIQRVLAAISEDTRHEAGFQNDHDYAEAQARVLAMRAAGSLNEASIFEFAKDRPLRGHSGGAFAALRGAYDATRKSSAERPLRGAFDTMQGRQVGVATVRLILTCRSIGHTKSDHDLDRAQSDYAKLSPVTAARVLRFWQVRQATGPDVAVPSPASPGVSQGSRSVISTHQ